MYKKIIILIIILFFYGRGFTQVNTFGEETESVKEWYFALRLLPSVSGGLVQTAIIKPESGGKNKIIFIPTDDWIRQILGLETSKANPSKENLINKYKVFEIPEEIKNDEVYRYATEKLKVILNNLWRLKYSEYPYFNPEMNNEKGWAKHPDDKITWMPSESQMRLLKPYGINSFSDFFTGEHLFDFLRDVTDRDWQNRYIQSAGVYNDQP